MRIALLEYGQLLAPLAPQLLNRIPARELSQPGGVLPAGRQDDLVVVMAGGLRAHRLNEVFVADQAAGPAADRPQVAQCEVHPVLSGGVDVVVGLRRDREFS